MDNKKTKEMMIVELECQRDHITEALNGRIKELRDEIYEEENKKAAHMIGKCFYDGYALYIIKSIKNKSGVNGSYKAFEVLKVNDGLYCGEGVITEDWAMDVAIPGDDEVAKDDAQKIFWSHCRMICRELFGEVDKDIYEEWLL